MVPSRIGLRGDVSLGFQRRSAGRNRPEVESPVHLVADGRSEAKIGRHFLAEAAAPDSAFDLAISFSALAAALDCYAFEPATGVTWPGWRPAWLLW